jgi:hypothetical protein
MDIGEFNMSQPIYIGLNGEQIEAEDELLEEVIESQLEAKKEQDSIKQELEKKAQLEKSANSKLLALGLTQAEIEALKAQ